MPVNEAGAALDCQHASEMSEVVLASNDSSPRVCSEGIAVGLLTRRSEQNAVLLKPSVTSAESNAFIVAYECSSWILRP